MKKLETRMEATKALFEQDKYVLDRCKALKEQYYKLVNEKEKEAAAMEILITSGRINELLDVILSEKEDIGGDIITLMGV